jgi:hypothetical protein
MKRLNARIETLVQIVVRASHRTALGNAAISTWRLPFGAIKNWRWRAKNVWEKRCPMPSLFRFLFILGTLVGVSYGGLYVAATYFEPEPKEVSKPVPGVKIRK